MRISKKGLLPMSSAELLTLLKFDKSQPQDERLDSDTIEDIHDIAAERYEEGGEDDEEERALNLLQHVAPLLAPARA